MKRWNQYVNKDVELPEVDAFLEDLVAVCRKHKMYLSHEDGHGSFIVEPLTTGENFGWLLDATGNIPPNPSSP